MDFQNLGFETWSGPGQPAAWNVSVISTAEEAASFTVPGSSYTQDEDRFEKWTSDPYALSLAPDDVAGALFDQDVSEGETREDFEEGWSLNHGYSFTMGGAEDAVFDTSDVPEPLEDFEESWPDASPVYQFTMGSTSTAVFDSGSDPLEDFEEGWRSNESYQTIMGTTTAAEFNGAVGQTYEGFEAFPWWTSDIVFMVDSQTSGDITFSGGFVDRITDELRGVILEQLTSGSRPAYTASNALHGGHPTIDVSNGKSLSSPVVVPAGWDEFSVIFQFSASNVASGGNVLSMGLTANNSFGIYFDTNVSGAIAGDIRTTGGGWTYVRGSVPPLNIAQRYIFSVRRDQFGAPMIRIFRNGALDVQFAGPISADVGAQANLVWTISSFGASWSMPFLMVVAKATDDDQAVELDALLEAHLAP